MSASERPWVEVIADDVVATAEARGKSADSQITVASGVSPSGPIHLGNFREIIVPHAVAEELAHRGRPVRHLHFWDDYDRFRRVPASVPESFEQYIGRPLSAVPDPQGDCHSSYAEHFISELVGALDALRIAPEQIRQSEAYARGMYADGTRKALGSASIIDEVLARHRTKRREDAPDSDDQQDQDLPLPLRLYCEVCGRDFTQAVVGDEPGTIDYSCEACGHRGTVSSAGVLPGKLVWKVDWPMRWAHYGVDFEAGGVDHSSPGSSYDVGRELVERVFGGAPPLYVGYSFVGIEGRSKLSGSHGDVPTPAMALRVLEPRILRWQYLRRRPQASFNVSFGSEVLRLYDEWDALGVRVTENRAGHSEAVFRRMSIETTAGEVPGPTARVPFRILAAAADVTQGDRTQMLRVVAAQTGEEFSIERLTAQSEPRLSCAIEWALSFQPEDERTRVRSKPVEIDPGDVSDEDRAALTLLLAGFDDRWTVAGLTELVYGVPKLMRGQTLDAPPDGEMKQQQHAFFALLYRLLTYAETGPRLPTLLLSIGREHVVELLSPFADDPATVASVLR
jgi:lysyl-tRNA synthetase, class I